MAMHTTQTALAQIFHQRCFWLFVVLIVLIAAVAFVPANDHGRVVLNAVNVFVLVATVAAVGRTRLSFLITLLLAIPAVVFQYIGLVRDSEADLAVSWILSAALYSVTFAYLIRYVFQPRIMTQDKLFGAAAAYLLIGVLWAYIYSIVGYYVPDSYMVHGQSGPLAYADALYYSITVLTGTGFGDVSPISRAARGICMFEQLTGALFVALLIARLAGVYPARATYTDEPES